MSKYIELKKELVEEKIADIQYVLIGEKTTICCIILKSGFEITGKSVCVNLEDYDKTIGKNIAYNVAFNNLVEMEAYRLAYESQVVLNDCDEIDYDCDEQERDCCCESDCDCDEDYDFEVDEDEDDNIWDEEDESEEFDFENCKCYDCDAYDCSKDCNDGCPHIECPKNEDNDFQEYEDDGTESYPEPTETPEPVALEPRKASDMTKNDLLEHLK